METLDILDRVVDVIDCSVNATAPPLTPIQKGDTELIVSTEWRCAGNHLPGDYLAIHDNAKLEKHKVRCIQTVSADNIYLITLCDPVASDFNAPEVMIQKLHHNRLVQNIVVGNPDHLSGYPSITVELLNVSREPLTLTDWLETYPFVIGVWVDATHYDEAYRCMIRLATLVKNGLTNARLGSNLFLQETDIASFDDAVDGDHLLKSATVNYSVKMLRRRRRNDIEDSCFEWWFNESPEAAIYLRELMSNGI
ncbi:hypothetical protein C4585_01530 [Candidatus Parcubacteria bacterium]|nr:MAG: hypothetical protein C4585_01530 [Candidatus Parcubacteria bacterium]